jgi:hypothetical protein
MTPIGSEPFFTSSWANIQCADFGDVACRALLNESTRRPIGKIHPSVPLFSVAYATNRHGFVYDCEHLPSLRFDVPGLIFTT